MWIIVSHFCARCHSCLISVVLMITCLMWYIFMAIIKCCTMFVCLEFVVCCELEHDAKHLLWKTKHTILCLIPVFADSNYWVLLCFVKHSFMKTSVKCEFMYRLKHCKALVVRWGCTVVGVRAASCYRSQPNWRWTCLLCSIVTYNPLTPLSLENSHWNNSVCV